MHPGCLKCISGMNLSPANKNFFTISFNLYLVLTCWYPYNKTGPCKGILLKVIPKLLNNPQASRSLINLYFLLLQTAQFDITIILPIFFLQILGFYCLLFLYTLNNKRTLFYKLIKIFDWLFESLNFWFLLPSHYILLTHYLLQQIQND